MTLGGLTFDRYCRHVLDEAARFHAAFEAAPESVRVPACPDWDRVELRDHQAGVLAFWIRQLADDADLDELRMDGVMEQHVRPVRDLADEVVARLTAVGPDHPCWNWSGVDKTAAWVARRMAQEISVHRFDAESIGGDVTAIDDDMARDGIDELLDVFVEAPAGTSCTGGLVVELVDPETRAVLTADGAVRTTDVPVATLHGSASDVLLALWGRASAAAWAGAPRGTRHLGPPGDVLVTPDTGLWARLQEVAAAAGLDAVGVAAAEVFASTRADLVNRKAEGLHADMQFTYRNPERSTDPVRHLPDARSLVVGALSYLRDSTGTELDGPAGRVARYVWEDHYTELRHKLGVVAAALDEAGWRTRILVDDNALVDREAAHRAGIGWYGKNANLLLPGRGSWFVLGSVLTDAPLPPVGTARRRLRDLYPLPRRLPHRRHRAPPVSSTPTAASPGWCRPRAPSRSSTARRSATACTAATTARRCARRTAGRPGRPST